MWPTRWWNTLYVAILEASIVMDRNRDDISQAYVIGASGSTIPITLRAAGLSCPARNISLIEAIQPIPSHLRCDRVRAFTSMWQRIDIYIHVYLRPSMSAELRNIREKNQSKRDFTTIRSYRKRQNQTFPDPVPMPTHLPDIAEHTGRYSVGSHNTSWALLEIQVRFGLIATSRETGCWSSVTVLLGCNDARIKTRVAELTESP